MKGNQVEKKSRTQTSHYFSQAERDGLYKTIFNRRDVRSQFKPEPIPDDVLSRVLYAAHHAPSVGFMQPWNFLLIREKETKNLVHSAFVKANALSEKMFEGEKRQRYSKLKLQGILESPINICITCDRKRTGSVVLGRTINKEVDLFSTVCAVQNLWLAARAEGLGVGWVSIIDHNDLRAALDIPDDIVPIAYLCVGYVTHFNEEPDLQTAGWSSRMPLEDLVFYEKWGSQKNADTKPLSEAIDQHRIFPNHWK